MCPHQMRNNIQVLARNWPPLFRMWIVADNVVWGGYG